MSSTADAVNNENVCHCGRDKDRRHCPICGHINFYALKKKANRPHPRTGVMTDATIFRCRSCNSNFDDLQWQYDCNAPRSKRTEQQEYRAATKEHILRQAESGVKFNENDRRHFRKVVGMSYEDYMQMWRITAKQKQQAIEAQVNKLRFAQPPTFKTNVKLSPLQWHIENCNYCNSHADNCEIAKQLEAAEQMENKP
jgi:hypothetical protein